LKATANTSVQCGDSNDLRELTKPHNIADNARLDMIFPLEGASADSTPIWIPKDPIARVVKPVILNLANIPKFANPHRANSAIALARSERGSALSIMLFKSVM
jgi:hypothetical protein